MLKQTIEGVLLNRVKLIADNEWTLIGTPVELIDELAEQIQKIEDECEEYWRHFYGAEYPINGDKTKGDK